MAVSIPAGIEGGTQIRLTGEGEPGTDRGRPGDLYVAITVGDHQLFDRNGYDIVYAMPINVSQAALGATVKVPTLEGESHLEVPPGMQSGQVFRIKGQGVPHLRSNRRGDQLVRLIVETPKAMTEEQQRLFQELAETFGDGKAGYENGDKGWLGKIKDAFGGEV